jgi:hypothetical protein
MTIGPSTFFFAGPALICRQAVVAVGFARGFGRVPADSESCVS